MNSVWKKKEKAHEDAYFERLEKERLQKLASRNKNSDEQDKKPETDEPAPTQDSRPGNDKSR